MKEAFENTEAKPSEKLKVTKADIIVTGTKKKPYFEIKYKEVGKKHYNIGFGSYDLNNVFKWREEEMEIVSEVEAEYINKSTEHINKSRDCSTNWIDVKDRLPDIGERVLLWVYGKVCIGERIDSKQFEKYDIFSLERDVNESTKRIEAWMPLPESYNPAKGEPDAKEE